MKGDLYHYRGTVGRIVDGDTVDITLDLGFRLSAQLRCRLWGINTPERGQIGAIAAGDYLLSLVAGKTLYVETLKDPDSFGRWLVILMTEGGVSINDEMVRAGHAVDYRR